MTSYPCPACFAEANLDTGCPNCGRAPDPVAAEVIALDAKLAGLRPRLAEARAEVDRAQARYVALADEFQAASNRRSQLAAQVRAGRLPVPAQPPAPARPETSTQTVKNVLFVLGGILLSVAAIAFTAFAWGQFGMAGKAVILALITAATLAVPVVALRRDLRGTAETFAALGLVLVALDGYSIWRVNLGGVQAMSGWTYAGLVAGITSAVAVLYGRMLHLTAPLIIGLVVAQPVLPLVFQPYGDGRPAGLALVFSAVAAANLLVVRLRFSVLQLLASLAYAISLVVAHGFGFAALNQAGASRELAVAAGVTLLAGAVAVAGPLLRPQALWLTAATAWCTVLTVLVGMIVAIRLTDHARLWTVGLIAGLAVITAVIEVRGRGAVWRGTLIGSAATGGIAAAVVAAFVSTGAVVGDQQNVSVEVLLLTGAAIVLTRRAAPLAAALSAVAGAVALALAIPAGFDLVWLPGAVDLTATAGLLAVLLWRRPPDAVRLLIAIGVAVLCGHSVLASADQRAGMAYTLGGLVVIAAGTAVVGRWRDRIAGVAAIAVTAPLVVGFAAAVAWAADGDPLHAMALTAAGLPIGVWAVRRWYARPADLAARGTILTTLLIAVVLPDDAWSKSVYVAGAAAALAVLPRTGLPERIAGWSVLGLGLLLARPPLLVVLEPYGWISGPAHLSTVVTLADVLAIAVLTATLWPVRPVLYSALPVPVALMLVYFGLVWPWLPLLLLASGLALVAYAVWRSPWCAVFGLVLAGSGLAGLSIHAWSRITGLAVLCLFAGVIASLARPFPLRIGAWLVFAVSWLGLALNVARTTGLSERYVVLGAAAALVLASAYLARFRSELRVLEIPAQMAAVAVIVVSPSAAVLSSTSLIWGVVLALSIFPRFSRRAEWVLRLATAGLLEIVALWAQLIARDVTVVEAYSLPVAGVALLVGFLAMRREPALSSWLGYGPALVAGFGPSLVLIVPVAGDSWRRLGLGVAALVVVIAGSVRRRQAPVVIGGAVLILVALHEVTQVWSRLPLWLPIGIGGAILLGFAITYERRLRDLRTLRSRISSFT